MKIRISKWLSGGLLIVMLTGLATWGNWQHLAGETSSIPLPWGLVIGNASLTSCVVVVLNFIKHAIEYFERSVSNEKERETKMIVKFDPTPGQTGAGPTSFASWSDPDMRRAMRQLESIEVTREGITARSVSVPHSPDAEKAAVDNRWGNI